MKIGIACDHGGLSLKATVKAVLAKENEVFDYGTDTDASVDYPDCAAPALKALKAGEVERLVLICGTGIGMSIAANRVAGVRATLVHDAYTARMSREHNDSNCLVLGARTTGVAVAEEIVGIWLETAFEGGRHQQRLDKADALAAKI
ncbi:MAG: putative sugar phosphate isomerase YwlF [Deltaproteobacteria bacterium ADurb.Bin510]|jgi:ribose 5-phosphate isomerase B|nr:MAG: putative sugar phosphate isomerase YwlF [Deltaproteobacteria bacterium ADurb.Bin510]